MYFQGHQAKCFILKNSPCPLHTGQYIIFKTDKNKVTVTDVTILMARAADIAASILVPHYFPRQRST